MARMNRLKKDGDAHYHVMSRTNGRAFLLKDPSLKGEMVEILRRTAEFSGVEPKAYCMMDDHFHIVCRVAKPEGPVGEKEVLRRIAVLKGECIPRCAMRKEIKFLRRCKRDARVQH